MGIRSACASRGSDSLECGVCVVDQFCDSFQWLQSPSYHLRVCGWHWSKLSRRDTLSCSLPKQNKNTCRQLPSEELFMLLDFDSASFQAVFFSCIIAVSIPRPAERKTRLETHLEDSQSSLTVNYRIVLQSKKEGTRALRHGGAKEITMFLLHVRACGDSPVPRR